MSSSLGLVWRKWLEKHLSEWYSASGWGSLRLGAEEEAGGLVCLCLPLVTSRSTPGLERSSVLAGVRALTSTVLYLQSIHQSEVSTVVT